MLKVLTFAAGLIGVMCGFVAALLSWNNLQLKNTAANATRPEMAERIESVLPFLEGQAAGLALIAAIFGVVALMMSAIR